MGDCQLIIMPSSKHPRSEDPNAPSEDPKRRCPNQTEETEETERGPHRAVVFDLDETAGTWGLGSLAFKMFHKFAGKPPAIDMFVRHYFECGGARPWLRELLKTLEGWKRIGRIDEVGIFTSASNINGWVTFLKDCMELYAQTPGLFKTCIAREDSPEVVSESGGVRTVKDLSLVSPDAEHVVLIDDKPENALLGYVIGVQEYTQDVCINGLQEWMTTEMPDYANEIDEAFAADAESHPPNGLDFRADGALWNAAQVLNTIFPEPVLAVQAAEQAAPAEEEEEDWRSVCFDV